MTFKQAQTRIRQTTTLERIVSVPNHRDECPARGNTNPVEGVSPMTCRCKPRGKKFFVVMA